MIYSMNYRSGRAWIWILVVTLIMPPFAGDWSSIVLVVIVP